MTTSGGSSIDDVLRAQAQLREAMGRLSLRRWDESERSLWESYFEVRQELQACEDLIKYHMLHTYFVSAHEAGHATFAIKECAFLQFNGVDIVANPAHGSLGGCAFLNWKTATKIGDVGALATLCMAGGQAGRLAAERCDLSLPAAIFSDETDREHALQVLDPERRWMPTQEHDALKGFSSRARDFLEANWETVYRVAMSLALKGKLNADEVRALVV